MMSSGATPLLQYWVVGRPLPGQCESGDQYLVATFPDGVLVAVVDGLGHGEEAAAAARTAIATLSQHAGDSPALLVQRCHEALKKTRGTVMSLASFNGRDNTMTWIGIGNVEGMLVFARAAEEGSKRASLISRGGIVGDQLPSLLPATLTVHPGDLLFLATDGIHSSFVRDIYHTEHPHELVHRIFSQCSRNTDDALLLGARWTNGETMPERKTN